MKGGAVAYRVALWHPDLVTRMFVICTPYNAPATAFIPIENIVKTKLPNFTYQIQLASGVVEENVQTKASIKKFLNGLYGGQGPNGEMGFTPKTGVLFDNLDKLKETKLLSAEMLDYYTEEYARNGIHGSLNWYRNRKQNFEDELQYELHTRNLSFPYHEFTDGN